MLLGARGQVDEAVLHLQVEEDRDVAELQVGVHQDGRRLVGVQPDRQVGRQRGAADPALGAVDDDGLAFQPAGPPASAADGSGGSGPRSTLARCAPSCARSPQRRTDVISSSPDGGLAMKSCAPARIDWRM